MSCASDVQRAFLLRATFPGVQALELLDLVFEDRVLLPEDCSALAEADALSPGAIAFLACAFDRGMTEAEWLAWQGPPAAPELQRAVRSLWVEHVIPAFVSRYTGVPRVLPRECDGQTRRAFRTL
jgi:hypothetical protein